MEREWAEPSLRVKASSSWGDGLEIFNDLAAARTTEKYRKHRGEDVCAASR